MTSISISVPALMNQWVESQVKSGRYTDPSDYLRDLIRRDQEESRGRDAIVSALVRGEESGTSRRQVPDIVAALRSERGDAGG